MKIYELERQLKMIIEREVAVGPRETLANRLYVALLNFIVHNFT